LQAIPSACWQCVSRDGIIGYVKNGRLVKIEGHPDLPQTAGRVCSKAQAGINQVYDPDRILHPMRRTGPRGAGQWKRISWDEALDEIAGRLKKLYDDGHPEKFMFHYGRMKGSSSKIVKSYFLPAYGTKTIGNHTSICEGGKWTAQELTWGKHYDVNDVARSKYIVVMGCNPLEAHTSHVPIAQRIADSLANGVKLVTFDVRLSNTAAKSDEWYAVRPGTDGAVALAMANVVMSNNLYDKAFIETWTNVNVQELNDHLAKYTPKWAEGISGVPASAIERIAKEYATTKPSTIVSYRGAVAHYNGVENERAIQMLEAITGNIDVEGGRTIPANAKWKNSYKKPDVKAKKLKILDGKGIVYPTHHVNHQVFKMIKDGSHGRPEVYMWYCYQPVYSNGDVQENIDVLKDEKLIPFTVAVDPFMTESSELADIILPDTTYLERWDWEDMVSYDKLPEYYIRQPLVKPLGEVRDFKDVCIDLAKRISPEVAKWMPFKSAKEFVKDACEHTPVVKAAGGFAYMIKNGVMVDEKGKKSYKGYAKKLKPKDLKGTVVDKKTGVVWKGKEGEDYTSKKSAYKKYVGQIVDGVAHKGFKPDKLNKSGRFEIKSEFLAKKGLSALPSYVPIPEHEKIKDDELILTTFKVHVQSHSRTQNCKWLSEIYHSNPAWIHPQTAAKRGIKNGDKIKVKSSVGEIVTKARVTEEVHPQVVAISMHRGHWAYGRYASGKKVFSDVKDEAPWWTDNGVHPNWIIPNAPAPVSGQQRWMDTVVKVTKA
jgi:anaerobic selenocysteine-containing dehydrogenase